MKYLKDILTDLTQIFFPHICIGCGTDVIDAKAVLCIRCLDRLPVTNFNMHANNLVEKIFWGRIPLVNASSLCYFSKDSLIRDLIHQLKYKSNKEAGYFLGKMMGESLRASNRFNAVEALVPLPLFPVKERRRGYNQAAILCEGMTEVMGLPIWRDVIKRGTFTDTQTKKSRIERWRNAEGRFVLVDADKIRGRHLLLVDDVVTTGATLEACGQELLSAEGVRLSVVTGACAVR